MVSTREEMSEIDRLKDGIMDSTAYFLEDSFGQYFVPIIRVTDEVELMITMYKEKVLMVENVIQDGRNKFGLMEKEPSLVIEEIYNQCMEIKQLFLESIEPETKFVWMKVERGAFNGFHKQL